MVVHCAICGKKFEAYKGRAKYCPHCRGEIENLKGHLQIYVPLKKLKKKLKKEKKNNV